MASQSDKNAVEIVSALRAAGCTVRYVEFQFGQAGCPDLLVGRAGVTHLLEVKTKLGRLSEPQVAFITEWQGGTPRVVRSPEEALAAVGLDPERRE
jgi:hypothetical protein